MHLQGAPNSYQEILGTPLFANSLVLVASENIRLFKANFELKDSICVLNFVEDQGGCIFGNQSNGIITNSIFKYNTASVGGAIYHTKEENVITENSVFEQNSAFYYGDDLATNDFRSLIKFRLDTFNKNLSKYYSFSEESSNESINNYIIRNVSKTLLDVLSINIFLTDKYGQVVLGTPFLTSSNDSAILPYKDENVAILRGNILKADEPNKTYVFELYVNASDNYTMRLEIVNRDCMPGEHYDNWTRSCLLGSPGSFSLDTRAGCIQCNSSNIFCVGGDILDVKPNYWRPANSAVLLPCLNDNVTRCVGGTDFNKQCATGYTGALCESCDYSSNYAIGSAYTCISCNENMVTVLTKVVVVIILAYLYELYTIYTVIQSNKNFVNLIMGKDDTSEKHLKFIQKYYFGIQLRLFTNYTQFIYIIFIYIQYMYLDIFSKINYILNSGLSLISNPSAQQSSSLECLLLMLGAAPAGITYTKIVISLIIPFAKLIMTVFLLLYLYKKGTVRELLNDVLVSVFTLIVNEQPGSVMLLARFYSCFLGGVDGDGYSDLDASIKCSDPRFLHFSHTVIIPGIIFWGILIPACLFIVLFKSRNSLNTSHVRKKYGALINSYQDNVYYWGLITMGFKLGLLLAFSLLGKTAMALNTGLLLMVIYYYLFVKLRPYTAEEFTNIEKLSIFMYIVSLFMLEVAASSPSQGFVSFIGWAVLISNLGTVIYILMRMVTSWNNSKKTNMDYKVQPSISMARATDPNDFKQALL